MRIGWLSKTLFGFIAEIDGEERHISVFPGYHKGICGYWIEIVQPEGPSKYTFVDRSRAHHVGMTNTEFGELPPMHRGPTEPKK